MKTLLLFLTSTLLCKAQLPLPKEFLNALHQVEASGRIKKPDGSPIIGDKGRALGPFQIHFKYWQDSGVSGSYTNCAEYDYSVKVVTGYMNRYATQFVLKSNYQAMARIHNGGPNGHKSESTLAYWRKVQRHLKKH